jgi:hypothetical protein
MSNLPRVSSTDAPRVRGGARLACALLAPAACVGTVGETTVPLEDSGIPAFWNTVTDCTSDPMTCTSGGDEPATAFDGKPFCTMGETVASGPNDWGASVVLSFQPPLDVTHLRISRLISTALSSSPFGSSLSWTPSRSTTALPTWRSNQERLKPRQAASVRTTFETSGRGFSTRFPPGRWPCTRALLVVPSRRAGKGYDLGSCRSSDGNSPPHWCVRAIPIGDRDERIVAQLGRRWPSVATAKLGRC